MKIFKTLAAAVALLAAPAVMAEVFAVNVGEFSEVNVGDGIGVTVKCNPDSAGTVVFECPPNVAPYILLSNDKRTLKVQLQNDAQLPRRLPRLTVYSQFVDKVSNSGDSIVNVVDPAPSGSIKLVITGNGNIVGRGLHSTVVEGQTMAGRGKLVLEGRANMLKLRTVGAGSIEAGTLVADRADVFMGGTGSVDCNVTGELTVKGLGSGKVYCKGKPKIKNRTLGTVKVIEID